MRIFFDTEFIEDGRTIELVSIGLVRQDRRSLYLQALGFQPSAASAWVQEHVLAQLQRCDRHVSLEFELALHRASGRPCSSMCPWRTRAELQQELIRFVGAEPEFWADYAAYDWIALAQIYGTMLDLPAGWPMYCRDVQQSRDELSRGQSARVAWPPRAAVHRPEHFALNDARDCLERYEFIEAERQRRFDVAGVRSFN